MALSSSPGWGTSSCPKLSSGALGDPERRKGLPRCGMRMRCADLYHMGARLQSNKVRTRSSSVTAP